MKIVLCSLFLLCASFLPSEADARVCVRPSVGFSCCTVQPVRPVCYAPPPCQYYDPYTGCVYYAPAPVYYAPPPQPMPVRACATSFGLNFNFR